LVGCLANDSSAELPSKTAGRRSRRKFFLGGRTVAKKKAAKKSAKKKGTKKKAAKKKK
jgi:hypothetical protein